MNDKLKPCPFCGGKAVRLNFLDRELMRTMFGCRKCHTTVQFARTTEAEAIEAWNTRADLSNDKD